MAPPLASFLFLLLIVAATTFTATAGGPTVSFSPKTLQKSGDSVEISWSGVKSPSKLDWLGIYSPSNSSSRNFIGYFFLSSSPTWESGHGSLTFPLVNLRSPYQFRIFRWSESEITEHTKKDHDQNPIPGVRHELARSEELTFKNLNAPEQIRLAFTGRESEMRVMFVTGDGRKSFVKYGTSQDDMEGTVETEVTRYEREDMCDAPANRSIGWRDPGYIHDGVIKDLKNGRRYYYQVGSDSGGWSRTYSFVSRDEESDDTVAFLYGDMGTATPYNTFIRTQDESRSTIKWILRDLKALGDKPAFISHIGDISYARGYAWIWDNFFNQVEPVSSQVAYHVCIGNHEYDWPSQPWKPEWAAWVYGKDGGGECGVPYSLRFKMPGNSSVPTGTRVPATRNLFYSFDMGSVHFVYFSTETDFLPGSSQFDFLKQDLESVDRKKTPFVVVQGHRPMYTTSHEDRDIPLTQRMLQHLEPLFVKNNVSVALWGHVHRYERFCPLNNFTCARMGSKGEYMERYPAHLVIGMAGQDWQAKWEPRPTHPDIPVFPQPARSLYRGGEFGYIRLFANKERLTLSYVGNHDGEVHDAMEILASGQALSGGGSGGSVGGDKDVTRPIKTESALPLYVKGASVLILGAFLGYVIGFVSRSKREPGTAGSTWLPVKTQES